MTHALRELTHSPPFSCEEGNGRLQPSPCEQVPFQYALGVEGVKAKAVASTLPGRGIGIEGLEVGTAEASSNAPGDDGGDDEKES